MHGRATPGIPLETQLHCDHYQEWLEVKVFQLSWLSRLTDKTTNGVSSVSSFSRVEYDQIYLTLT